MEPPPAGTAQLVEAPKRLARRLLTIGENRPELSMVEVQEERRRLLHARQRKAIAAEEKPSWFQRVLKDAQLANSIWLAFHDRSG
jgi:hypothetical protein